jgi:hypothetical protein
MELGKLHNFYLSYKVNGEIHIAWIEALNLRHAKEKIMFNAEEASDIRDWTNERKEDLDSYLNKLRKIIKVTRDDP